MDLDDVIKAADSLGLTESFIRSISAPSVRLVATESTDGFSRLGGQPDLPPELEWPTFEVADYDAEEIAYADKGETPYMAERAAALRERGTREPLPLAFVAQLDLAQLAGLDTGLPLPKAGYLWFFYELEEQPWGYSPAHRGSFRVLFAEAGTRTERREAPAGVEVLQGTHVTATQTLSFRTWPELEDDEQLDAYESFQDDMAADDPDHRIGGHPDQIQGDMTRSCALVTQGVYLGGPPDLAPEELERLAARASEWRLLLQLDSDDDLDWMWGDCGRLYWWMREADIRAGNWDRAWFQLQCG